MWECPNCHEQNTDFQVYCERCKADRPEGIINSSNASAMMIQRQLYNKIPIWMYIVSFLFPGIGFCLITGLVARGDDTNAFKIFIATLLPTILAIVLFFVMLEGMGSF